MKWVVLRGNFEGRTDNFVGYPSKFHPGPDRTTLTRRSGSIRTSASAGIQLGGGSSIRVPPKAVRGQSPRSGVGSCGATQEPGVVSGPGLGGRLCRRWLGRLLGLLFVFRR